MYYTVRRQEHKKEKAAVKTQEFKSNYFVSFQIAVYFWFHLFPCCLFTTLLFTLYNKTTLLGLGLVRVKNVSKAV